MAHKATFIAGVALAAALAAGGSAFTASNTVPNKTLGYGSNTVSGATVSSLAYNLNAAGDNVNSVTLVLTGDTTASAVSLGFNGGTAVSCGSGTFDAVASKTTYTCNNGGANYTQSTSTLTSTNVVVN